MLEKEKHTLHLILEVTLQFLLILLVPFNEHETITIHTGILVILTIEITYFVWLFSDRLILLKKIHRFFTS